MHHILIATTSAHNHFERAMRRGYWKRLSRKMRHEPIRLENFDSIHERLKPYEQSDRDITTIPLSQIVGSIGRANEFDRDFMPISTHIEGKWQHILMLQAQGIQLPPVDVYQVEETYHVIDGNHRISVSRFLGIEYVDAHVIELRKN